MYGFGSLTGEYRGADEMKILMVDDNPYVLSGLLDGIDFKGLGFDEVFTAPNARKARELLDQVTIEILITDIEMPNGSGLKLLEWVNEQHPGIVTLFCTSYADFNYAQEALRLHCFDYYVKPIRYADFTEHLKRAIDEVKRTAATRQIETYGHYWMDAQWNNKADFWYKYLYRLSRVTEQEIAEEIAARRLEYAPEDEVCICIVKVGRTSKVEGMTTETRDFVFKNISEEIFRPAGYEPEGLLITANHTLTIILRKAGGQAAGGSFRALCATLLESLCRYVAKESNCYYREHIPIARAQEALEQLEEIALDDISNRKSVIDYDRYIREKREERKTDFSDWEELFFNRQTELLVTKIREYLSGRVEEKTMSGQFLREVRSWIVQMSGTILRKNETEAYRLFDDTEYDDLFGEAVTSVSGALGFAEYVIYKTNVYLDGIEKSQTVAERVRQFIKQNYNRNITRDEIENLSYMNLNQISKLFKQETGKSLHNYQMAVRIDRAAQMLREGTYSISEIAQNVGYDNFSYFSRLFKDRTGYTPKEYRNRTVGEGAVPTVR